MCVCAQGLTICTSGVESGRFGTRTLLFLQGSLADNHASSSQAPGNAQELYLEVHGWL